MNRAFLLLLYMPCQSLARPWPLTPEAWQDVNLAKHAKLGIRVAIKNMKSATIATLRGGKLGFPAARDEFAELQKCCSCNPDRRKSFNCVLSELQELQIVAERCRCNSRHL